MAIERTLSIVKPDAVAKNVIGEIYSRFEKGGLKIVAARMMQLTRAQAEEFYAVHRERPFYNDLVEFMTSGPVMNILEILSTTNTKSVRAGEYTAPPAQGPMIAEICGMTPEYMALR